MRLLVDTNIYISYLLDTSGDSFLRAIFEKAIEGELILIVPEELLQELEEAVSRKKYLDVNIAYDDVVQLTKALRKIAMVMPKIMSFPHPISRDPKDDYLIVHASISHSDYLVTGDKDLLSLKGIKDFRIVTLHQMAKILQKN